MIITGPTFTIEESNQMRADAIMDLGAARPELAPEPYDPDHWTHAILVTVDDAKQIVGVPRTVRGTPIHICVLSLGCRVITPAEIDLNERNWLTGKLARMRSQVAP